MPESEYCDLHVGPKKLIARFRRLASLVRARISEGLPAIPSPTDEAIAMRSKLCVFPDDAGASAAAKSSVHKISYKYIGAQRDRMRGRLLKGGLRLAVRIAHTCRQNGRPRRPLVRIAHTCR